MSEAPHKHYGIQELAELGGVSRRTVRYYVRRGLIPAPTGTGRGKHYNQEHLDALIRIRTLQESGVPLNAIGTDGASHGTQSLASPAPQTTVVLEQSAWTRVVIRTGVELHLQGRHALNSAQMAKLNKAIASILDVDPNTKTGSPAKEEEGDE